MSAAAMPDTGGQVLAMNEYNPSRAAQSRRSLMSHLCTQIGGAFAQELCPYVCMQVTGYKLAVQIPRCKPHPICPTPRSSCDFQQLDHWARAYDMDDREGSGSVRIRESPMDKPLMKQVGGWGYWDASAR